VKKLIRNIEGALGSIYHLELSHKAEDFLLVGETGALRVGTGLAHAKFKGALLVSREEGQDEDEVEIGIYFSQALMDELVGMGDKSPETWTRNQKAAFGIATEEISHFHYFLFHACTRGVSQLELEIQGDIDKFLLLFFSQSSDVSEKSQLFERTYQTLFEDFALSDSLTPQQSERYIEANRFAAKLIRDLKDPLQHSGACDLALKTLRRFYRLDVPHKVSCLGP